MDGFLDTIENYQVYSTVTAHAAATRWIVDSSTPGRFDPDECPPMNEIANCCSPSHPAQRVVIMGGNQIGKTVMLFNVLWYIADQAPGPVQWVIPKATDVADYSTKRFEPFIGSSRATISTFGAPTVQKGTGTNRVGMITFPGGYVKLAGSKPAETYQEAALRYVIFDDYSRFSDNEDGDHVALAEARLNTYSRAGGKLIAVSTPTVAPDRTETLFEETSQNRYHVPCPHCGGFQVLQWNNLKWTKGQTSTAHFVCIHCRTEIYEGDKREMLMAGRWVPDRPEYVGKYEGFHYPAYYARSMSRTWAKIAEAWEQALFKLRAHNDDSGLRASVNLDRAESFTPPQLVALAQHEQDVYLRREPESAIEQGASAHGIISTAGTDRQHDRLESAHWVWGNRLEGWIKSYKVHTGDTKLEPVWDEWADWIIASGIRAVCVDASDETTATCSEITRLLPRFLADDVLVWVIKGDEGSGKIWPKQVPPGNVDTLTGLAKPVTVKVDECKTQVYNSLFHRQTPGPGYLHFGLSLTKKWFKQLFSCRERSSTDRAGRSKYIHVKGRRREAIDATDYALAALHGAAAIGEPSALRAIGIIETAPVAPRRPAPVAKRRAIRKKHNSIGSSIL